MNRDTEQIVESLLPRPRTLTRLSADYPFDETCTLNCMTPTACLAGARVADLIGKEWGIHLPVRNEITDGECVLYLSNSPPSVLQSVTNNIKVSSLRDEEYLLRVTPDGVIVRARTPRALLWGAMTLRQLVRSQGNSHSIVGVEIHDYPRYAMRGFMVDSGRAPNSLPKLKRIIRVCSAFKLNALFFREGDDEMNALRYKTNKLGSLNPFAFTMEELGDLSSYAKHHGIALVCEVESLGHSAAKRIHYPELVEGGFEEKYEGIGSHTRKSHLIPCDPRTFELLESMYCEIFATLRQSHIHLGMDEVRLSAEKQARHLTELLPRVFRCAERYGIEASPIVWSDAPETPDEYKSRVCRCLWGYGDGGDIGVENKDLARQGLAALSQLDCTQPVLMAGGSGSGHTPYSKSSFAGAYRNLAAWAKWGESLKNHIGLLAVQWSGNMTDEWLPDFLAAADFGWVPPSRVPTQGFTDGRISEHLSRLTDASSPLEHEMDAPAWDGIWLKGGQWDKDILTPNC